MPNLTTHINFIKYLTNKKYNNYDLNYLVLGSIAQIIILFLIMKKKVAFLILKKQLMMNLI